MPKPRAWACPLIACVYASQRTRPAIRWYLRSSCSQRGRIRTIKREKVSTAIVYTSSARAYAPAVTDDHMLPGERVRARVNLVRWAQVIPANAWPSGLPQTGVLCRRDVFAVAGQWSAGHITVRALLAASCMWGNGSAGYGPARTLTALRADPNGDKLEHNLEPLRGQHPSEADLRSAYQRFNSASPTHLRGLGPCLFQQGPVLRRISARRRRRPAAHPGQARSQPPAACGGSSSCPAVGLAKRALDCLPEMGSRPGHPDRVRRGTRHGRDGLVQRRMGAG